MRCDLVHCTTEFLLILHRKSTIPFNNWKEEELYYCYYPLAERESSRLFLLITGKRNREQWVVYGREVRTLIDTYAVVWLDWNF